jgi:hypothetical protein
MQVKQQDALVTFHTTHFTVLSVALQYKVPRRLLWRRKHWLEGRWCHDEINSVHKLLVHITKHIHHPTRWKRYMQGSKCLPLLCSKIAQCADYRVSCNCLWLLQLSERNEENHEILSGYPVNDEEIKNWTSWILGQMLTHTLFHLVNRTAPGWITRPCMKLKSEYEALVK